MGIGHGDLRSLFIYSQAICSFTIHVCLLTHTQTHTHKPTHTQALTDLKPLSNFTILIRRVFGVCKALTAYVLLFLSDCDGEHGSASRHGMMQYVSTPSQVTSGQSAQHVNELMSDVALVSIRSAPHTQCTTFQKQCTVKGNGVSCQRQWWPEFELAWEEQGCMESNS